MLLWCQNRVRFHGTSSATGCDFLKGFFWLFLSRVEKLLCGFYSVLKVLEVFLVLGMVWCNFSKKRSAVKTRAVP